MAIKALEQEPKTGHWIVKNERYYICSKCKRNYDKYYNELKDKNYCPNCGAKMVEPQESED